MRRVVPVRGAAWLLVLVGAVLAACGQAPEPTRLDLGRRVEVASVRPAEAPALTRGSPPPLRDFLLGIHTDPQGKRLLDALLIDRFVPVDPNLFRIARVLRSTP
jgi:hypothetical protein